MNRLGPFVPIPLTVEFSKAEAEQLEVVLHDTGSQVAEDLLDIIQTYLGE